MYAGLISVSVWRTFYAYEAWKRKQSARNTEEAAPFHRQPVEQLDFYYERWAAKNKIMSRPAWQRILKLTLQAPALIIRLGLLRALPLIFPVRFIAPLSLIDERDRIMTKNLLAISLGRQPLPFMHRWEARYIDAEKKVVRYRPRSFRSPAPAPEEFAPPLAGSSDAIFAVVGAAHVACIVRCWNAACAARSSGSDGGS